MAQASMSWKSWMVGINRWDVISKILFGLSWLQSCDLAILQSWLDLSLRTNLDPLPFLRPLLLCYGAPNAKKCRILMNSRLILKDVFNLLPGIWHFVPETCRGFKFTSLLLKRNHGGVPSRQIVKASRLQRWRCACSVSYRCQNPDSAKRVYAATRPRKVHRSGSVDGRRALPALRIHRRLHFINLVPRWWLCANEGTNLHSCQSFMSA